MANIAPPSVMSGAASFAIRTKEWQETSIALANPSAEQLRRIKDETIVNYEYDPASASLIRRA